MQRRRKGITLDWILAVFALLCVIAIFGYVMREIGKEAVEYCNEQLEYAASEVALKVRNDMNNTQEQLRIYARILSEEAEIDGHMENLLKAFAAEGVLSRMELFLPNGQVLTSDGREGELPEGFSFEELAVAGEHISTRQKDRDGEFIIRCYTPVLKAGETKGILCGVIRLDTLPNRYFPEVYGGKAHLYLIEARSGKFLIDTWHEELTSSAEVGTRQTKDGSTTKPALENMRNGVSGTLVAESHTVDEYLYARYTSVGIQDWTVLLFVEESIVFENALKIENNMRFLALGEGVLLAAFFLWMLFKERKYVKLRERRLKQAHFMLDVEKCLLNAPHDGKEIEKALCRLAGYFNAKTAFVLEFEKQGIGMEYSWWRDSESRVSLQEGFPALNTLLKVYEPAVYRELPRSEEEMGKAAGFLRKTGIKNLMTAPLLDMDGVLMGVLGVANIGAQWESAEELQGISLSFSLAYGNLKAFQKFQELGTVDSLTRIWNRNKYQLDLEEYEKKDSDNLHCVYMDADGLHALNNSKGHEEGDRMLKYIAVALRKYFGYEVYRIGGDEFIAFSNLPKEEVESLVQLLCRMVEEKGYHMSAGVSCREDYPRMPELVRAAEQEMYRKKKEYYTGEQRQR